MYVLDEGGTRVPCPHPSEDDAVLEVTGLSIEMAERRGRIVYVRPYLCVTCGEVGELDRTRDPERCVACGSASVVAFAAVQEAGCPRCSAPSLTTEAAGVS